MNEESEIMSEAIRSSDEIISAAKELAESGRRKMVAVAGAQDADVIGALASANADGILDATLYGDAKKIRKLAKENGSKISKLTIEDYKDAGEATWQAVKAASEGRADVIMKGFVATSSLLKTVLAKDFGLRTGNIISHVAVLDIPGYHKLLAMTDGGMVVAPDRDQKKQLIANASLVCMALGISPVKVALSGAIDYVDTSVPMSLEADSLTKEYAQANEPDIIVQGPLTFDMATSPEKAVKIPDNKVAGDADVYLVSTIEECNIIAKSLINFSDTVFAGVIVGAKVPVSLVSRTDTMKNKKASVSIACLLAEYYRTIAFGGEA